MRLKDVFDGKKHRVFDGRRQAREEEQKPENREDVILCPTCGAQIRKDPKKNAYPSLCPNCGADLSMVKDTVSRPKNGHVKDLTKSRSWRRDAGDFALRFELPDLDGFFMKEVTVEPGTKALFIKGGKYRGELNPGVYTLKTLPGAVLSFIKWNRIEENRATVILVDSGEISIPFTVNKELSKNLYSRDNYPVGLRGQVTAQIQDPLAFMENFLKGAEYVQIIDINMRISKEIQMIAQSVIREYDAEELFGNMDLKFKLESYILRQLNANFGTKGFEILTVPFIEIDLGEYATILEARRKAEETESKIKSDSHIAALQAEADAQKQAAIHAQQKKDAQHNAEIRDIKHNQTVKETRDWAQVQAERIEKLNELKAKYQRIV